MSMMLSLGPGQQNFAAIIGASVTILTALIGGYFKLKSNQERLFRAQERLTHAQEQETLARAETELYDGAGKRMDLLGRMQTYEQTILDQQRTIAQQEQRLTVHARTIERLQDEADNEKGETAALRSRLNRLEAEHRLLLADRDEMRRQAENCADRCAALEGQLARLLPGEPAP